MVFTLPMITFPGSPSNDPETIPILITFIRADFLILTAEMIFVAFVSLLIH